MEENEYEIAHYSKDGQLYHSWYQHTKRKGLVVWQRVPGSERECKCLERSADRLALLGIGGNNVRQESECEKGTPYENLQRRATPQRQTLNREG